MSTAVNHAPEVNTLEVTKADLQALEGSLKGEIADLRGEFGKLEGTLKGQIADLKGFVCLLGFAILAAMVALRYLPPLPAGT
ncbi:MAG: hypothetical protein OXG56_11230 [Gammaproteobacteria bacterium]|nr:hypothetical protein [Gammaproteobacteria bacterium]